MQLKINPGAYGWRHKHWSGTFYPEDLPMVDEDQSDNRGDGPVDDWAGGRADDWRLAYYSNEFNSVLIPADYWQTAGAADCEQWLDSVHDDFQFFVECNSSMLDDLSLEELTAALTKLKPQLSALVVLDGAQAAAERVVERNKQLDKNPFIELAVSLEVEIIDVSIVDSRIGSRFAFFRDELTDLRKTRVAVEQFVAQIDSNLLGSNLLDSGHTTEAVIIVAHPQLQAANLSKFRAVLEVMGY